MLKSEFEFLRTNHLSPERSEPKEAETLTTAYITHGLHHNYPYVDIEELRILLVHAGWVDVALALVGDQTHALTNPRWPVRKPILFALPPRCNPNPNYPYALGPIKILPFLFDEFSPDITDGLDPLRESLLGQYNQILTTVDQLRSGLSPKLTYRTITRSDATVTISLYLPEVRNVSFFCLSVNELEQLAGNGIDPYESRSRTPLISYSTEYEYNLIALQAKANQGDLIAKRLLWVALASCPFEYIQEKYLDVFTNVSTFQ